MTFFSGLHEDHRKKCQPRMESAHKSYSQGLEGFVSKWRLTFLGLPKKSHRSLFLSAFSFHQCVNVSNWPCMTGKSWNSVTCKQTSQDNVSNDSCHWLLAGIGWLRTMLLAQRSSIWAQCPPLVERLMVILSWSFFNEAVLNSLTFKEHISFPFPPSEYRLCGWEWKPCGRK